MRATINALVNGLLPDAVLGPLLKRRFFATQSWANRHWGVFESFDAARRFAAEQGAKAMFTLDQRKWLEDHQGLMAHDYPMLFWLTQILDGRPARIADLGGSVGVSYYAFARVMAFAPGLRWEVCELPETAELGREIARQRGAAALSFGSDPKQIDGADVLFTAGTIQYIETPLADTLAELATPPRNLLINRLPLTGKRSTFVTLQHSGLSPVPYRVTNAQAFLQSMEAIGYRQRDRWKCLENFTAIPLHPELTLTHFHGFYFDHA